MWLAEHESEGHNEDLVAEIVSDMQHPAAPILGVAPSNKRTHHAGGVVTCLGQIGYRGGFRSDAEAIRSPCVYADGLKRLATLSVPDIVERHRGRIT
jgi:hypothetical protein